MIPHPRNYPPTEGRFARARVTGSGPGAAWGSAYVRASREKNMMSGMHDEKVGLEKKMAGGQFPWVGGGQVVLGGGYLIGEGCKRVASGKIWEDLGGKI